MLHAVCYIVCRHVELLLPKGVSQSTMTTIHLWKMASRFSILLAAFTTVVCLITTGKIVYWRWSQQALMLLRRMFPMHTLFIKYFISCFHCSDQLLLRQREGHLPVKKLAVINLQIFCHNPPLNNSWKEGWLNSSWKLQQLENFVHLLFGSKLGFSLFQWAKFNEIWTQHVNWCRSESCRNRILKIFM